MISRTKKDRYSSAKKIFFEALEMNAANQSEFIEKKCRGDLELHSEVRSLLASRSEARSFLESPALDNIFQFGDSFENRSIGNCRLIRKIGSGGMGLVFLAERPCGDFAQKVAIKIVKSDVYSKAVIKRFHLERRILSRLDHPNVARLIDGGRTENGFPFLIMEYVEGVSLIEFVETRSLNLEKRIELFLQLCDAVSFAHKNAVIHRDLKPSNILVNEKGRVKLLDFGIAKILSGSDLAYGNAETTFRAMTPDYASPEQIKSSPVTIASDIYSLGVILYELLTGTNPQKSASQEDLDQIVRTVCDSEPTRPSSAARFFTEDRAESAFNQSINYRDLRGDLDNIVLKALRKKPARRYSSVENLSEDLRRHFAGLPVSARPNTLFYRTQKFVLRNRLAVFFALFAILALIAGSFAAFWQARRAEEQRLRAEQRFEDVRMLVNSFMFELNDEIMKGQTPARALVVRRALEYLDRLADESNNQDFSLQTELAVAYLKIGDIQGKPYSPNLGNTAGALTSYLKALSILKNLHRQSPENRVVTARLALTYASIGSIQETRQNQTGNAIENLVKARILLEPLIREEPTNVEYKRLLADVYKYTGDATHASQDKIAFHRKALTLREELLMDHPHSVEDLSAAASCHQRIGTALKNITLRSLKSENSNARSRRQKLETVLGHFDKALFIYRKLIEIDRKNSRHRRNFADISAMSLPIYAALGDAGAVENKFQTAINIFSNLSAADPQNFEARLDIAFTKEYMCQSLIKLRAIEKASRFCREAADLSNELLARDPMNQEVRHLVLEIRKHLSQIRGKRSITIKRKIPLNAPSPERISN